MRRAQWALALGLVPLLSAATTAHDEAPYLNPRLVPNGLEILPPPPRPGSAQEKADRALFQQTRKLKGGARWRLAADDAVNAPLDRYACAMNLQVTARSAPVLAHLLEAVGTGGVVDPVKTYYHVPRPYLREAGPICEPRTPHLDSNGDYPSGHAANGWLEALVLAAVEPQRATQILTRGRQYGESRLICGVHSASAVEAGWMAGSATFAALSGGSPNFRRDVERARQELTAIAHAAPRPSPARCAAEARALADHPW